jgi:molybdenum cofactor cytidylyltransferase
VGLLLAAGRGQRFGTDKRLHLLPDGRPMAVAAAAHLAQACRRCLVVIGPHDDHLARLLAAQGFATVRCPEASAGMGHSLAAGVRASADAPGWVVALADMPFIHPTSHHAVAQALRAGASLAASSYHGQRGHPVGFASTWREPLSQLTGDQGGKQLLRAHADQLLLCPTEDPGVLRDIDRPDDLTP